MKKTILTLAIFLTCFEANAHNYSHNDQAQSHSHGHSSGHSHGNDHQHQQQPVYTPPPQVVHAPPVVAQAPAPAPQPIVVSPQPVVVSPQPIIIPSQPAYTPPPQPPQQPVQPEQQRWAKPKLTRTQYSYFKGSIGSADTEDFFDSSGDITFDGGVPINVAYGVSSGNIAFEGELGFSGFDYTFNPVFGSNDFAFDGELSATKLMFNAMLKTSKTGSNLYIGAGFGFVSVTLDGIEDELSGSSLASQLIAGAELRTSERSSFFVEYKTLASSGLELENAFTNLEYDFDESSLNVGVKLYF